MLNMAGYQVGTNCSGWRWALPQAATRDRYGSADC